MSTPCLTLTGISVDPNPAQLDSPMQMTLTFQQVLTSDILVSVKCVLDAAVNKQELILVSEQPVTISADGHSCTIFIDSIPLAGIEKRIVKNVALICVSLHVAEECVLFKLVCAIEERDGLMYRRIFSPLE